MTSKVTPVFNITPTTQKYDWGKIGGSGKVARFAAAQNSGLVIDESAPYAELWMGTHPKSPSRITSTGEVLSEYLAANPQLIGQHVIDKFGTADGSLPFLFKVLSIEKALSIQSHPDKATAEKLHATQPDIYKDPNHKPEMALAITPFRALCGFRPLSEIGAAIRSTPELAALIPVDISQAFLAISASTCSGSPAEKAALKAVFSVVMSAGESQFKLLLDTLVKRYKSGDATKCEDKGVVDLVLRLSDQFPGDIGIFCAFLLNYIQMKPGEAIFLGAGEPHAYLSGECIECMANSDNVIRAGLTPKLRDVPNLVSTLTYTAAPPSVHFVQTKFFGTSEKGASTLYDPPIPEFSVVQVRLTAGEIEQHRGIDGPSVAIITDGSGVIEYGNRGDMQTLKVSVGDVVFIGASVEVSLGAAGEGMAMYRAFVEV